MYGGDVPYKIIFKEPIPIFKRTLFHTKKQIGLCYEFEFDGKNAIANGQVLTKSYASETWLAKPTVPMKFQWEQMGDFGTNYTYDTSNIRYIRVRKKVTSYSQNSLWE